MVGDLNEDHAASLNLGVPGIFSLCRYKDQTMLLFHNTIRFLGSKVIICGMNGKWHGTVVQHVAYRLTSVGTATDFQLN